LDLIGLIDSVTTAVTNINLGRKGFITKGKEQEGRILYEKGIADALTSFKEAQISADPQIILIAEYHFISQEFQFCDKTDKDALNSLLKAIQSFDDAFTALKIVENHIGYRNAEKTYPNDKNYRVGNFPKDAFHIACISHKTRLKNVLRSPGINANEKLLLKQRILNLTAAGNSYGNKQMKALVDK